METKSVQNKNDKFEWKIIKRSKLNEKINKHANNTSSLSYPFPSHYKDQAI